MRGILVLSLLSSVWSSNVIILDSSSDLLAQFKGYIVGNFNNQKQVDSEKTAGNIEHPYSQHISDIANSKIINIPEDLKGFFVLEESYYTNVTSGVTNGSPFLFYFDASPVNGNVQITSYSLPKTIPATEFRNNNTKLVLDFNKDLSKSSVFKTSTYTFADQTFALDSKTDIAPGVFFVLQERISASQLVVLEQFSNHGQVFPSYKTPIIYDRV